MKTHRLSGLLKLILFILLVSLNCPAQTNTSFAQKYKELIENKSNMTDEARLGALFKVRWDYAMVESPEFATYVGYPGQDDRWTDSTPAAIERRNRELELPIKVIQSIDRSKLTPASQLNYDLVQRELDDSIEGIKFHSEYLAISQMGGPQQEIAQLLGVTAPHKTEQDYQHILTRLEGIPSVLSQCIILLQLGVDTGITQPRVTLRDIPKQVEAMCEPDPSKNPLLKAFKEIPTDIAPEKQLALRTKAASILTNQVIPAYAGLKKYLVETYIPKSRESIGLSALPDGKAWYNHNIKGTTTTSLTAEEIHAIGLKEVDRIHAEMATLIESTGFKGDFHAFNNFLRSNPANYYTNADELLSAYRDVTKRIDPELIKVFGRLPRLTYGVVAVPKYSEQSQTSAYYESGSLDAGRAGFYYVNTYDLRMHPKWEMETLTLHESVPGHHFQLSLALEMDEQPQFRKYQEYTAFVEGWGLYSESLGKELGLYKDPYHQYGKLSYEIFRAVRLVLDTGIHSMGWTRQQALDYFKANACNDEHDIIVEVDRYIVWPGQALAYKIGQLKFKELREFAKSELGEKFDERAFHDTLLANGALPLDIVDKHLREWIAGQTKK